MHRAVLMACLPWLAVLVVSVLIAYFLPAISRAWLQLGRLQASASRPDGRRAEPQFRAHVADFHYGDDVHRAGQPTDDRPDRGALRGVRRGPERDRLDSRPICRIDATKAELHQQLSSPTRTPTSVSPRHWQPIHLIGRPNRDKARDGP